MNVKHYVKQPYKSNICGHCCISMVTGMPLEDIVKAIGHTNGTNFLEQKKVFEQFNYKVGEFIKVDNRKPYNLPDFCLVRITKVNNLNGHLVVYDNGKFYDPARKIFDSKEDFLRSYNYYNDGTEKHRKWKIQYYYEVKKIDSKQLMVAGEKKERKYRVIVGHDILNTGTRQKLEKIMTETELENVKKSDKFEVIGFEAL